MKWHSTRIDTPPKDKQEVLVSVDGAHYIAVYDANKNIYRVAGELKETFFKADRKNLHWTKYSRPEAKED